jgi:hypothetical protein
MTQFVTRSESNGLKEWASVVSAVAAGDQVILVRKGGLADRNFGVKAASFLLNPTWLHQAENQFRTGYGHHFSGDHRDDEAELELSVFCEVVRSFELRELDTMLRLRDDVIFTDATIAERYAFRPDQALHVIAVRAHRLRQTVQVENLRRYGGCKSWITFETAVDFELAGPVVPDEELERRVSDIAAKLAG